MAATDSQLAAGRRLASDVRAIRRKHGIDLKEVLDATRLADDVVEQLEENALVAHPAFNRVYLRSLFGVYGEAIGVKKADMVSAVEEVFDGHYVGALARDYLGLSLEDGADDDMRPVDVESDPSETTHPEGEEDVEVTGDDDAGDKLLVVSEREETPPEIMASHESLDGSSIKGVGEDSASEVSEDSSGGVHEGAHRTVPHTQDVQKASGSVWAGLADRKTVLLPNMSGTVLMVIAGIAFVSLLWFSISTVMDLRSDDVVDGAALDTTMVEEVFQPDPVVLPDSLEVEIVAFSEPLDPIRITTDRDFRRPYWVELLDTHRVVITDRILLERQADHTRILVDGFLVPGAWLGNGAPVEISRSRVQTWLDSLVAEGIVPEREAPQEIIVPEVE
jgi:hypothetical protein